MSGGPSVPAAVFAAYVDNPWARGALILTAIGCAVLSSYFVWRQERIRVREVEEELRPKLKLSFGMDHPGCVKPAVVSAPPGPGRTYVSSAPTQGVTTTFSRFITDPQVSGLGRSVQPGSGAHYIYVGDNSIRGLYYRIQAETDGAGTVSECCGRLIWIKKDGQTILDGESIILPFAPSENIDRYNKRVSDLSSEYLDAIFITEGDEIRIVTDFWPLAKNQKEMFSGAGKYKFKIGVSSEAAKSVAIEILLDWKGDHNTVVIESCPVENISALKKSGTIRSYCANFAKNIRPKRT